MTEGPASGAAKAPKPPPTTVERLDDMLFVAEKLVVAGMLALMGVVVFLDVIFRVSTRTGGWLASPLFVGLAAVVVATLAFLTRGTERLAIPVPEAAKAPLLGVLVGVGVVVAQQVFIRVLPNGLVWSQTFALALTLWLGTIGASLAAHERRHLAMDVGAQLWPEHLRGKVAAVGHVLTAVFCIGLLLLGARSVGAHWDLWASTDGAAGNLSGLAIPKWFPALAIPYGMIVLAWRFGLEAWRSWTGRVVEDEDEVLHQLGIKAD